MKGQDSGAQPGAQSSRQAGRRTGRRTRQTLTGRPLPKIWQGGRVDVAGWQAVWAQEIYSRLCTKVVAIVYRVD